MSEMKPQIDLAALARATPATSVAPKKKRRLALTVTIVLVAGFAAVLFSTVGDVLRGAVRVTVVRPQAADAFSAAAGSTELQRSGWIEPDPYPVFATALAPGVVRELLVLEGDAVAAGQPLAELDDRSATVELAQADAALARARADAQKALVERDLAQQSFEAALEVTEAEATARAEARGRAAEADRRAAAAREASSKVRVAEEELALARFLAENGAAGPRQVELAQAKLDAERSALAVLEAETALAAAEVEKAGARLVRAEKERELRLADRLRSESAIAALAVAQAAVLEANTARDAAALKLERMVVRAPAAGSSSSSSPSSLVVLQRLAAPGAMVGTESREAVCTLFDPKSLRVRVDVEQSEVAKLAVGQPARVKAPTRPDRLYDGEVARIVRLANVEKVTLQVHVKVKEPDAALRPEMLVEVRFLAAGAGSSGADGSSMQPGSVWIPKRLVVAGESGPAVWIVDALSGRAALRRIDVARDDGDRTLVRGGLNVSDKVIDAGREELRDGARVEITSEGK